MPRPRVLLPIAFAGLVAACQDRPATATATTAAAPTATATSGSERLERDGPAEAEAGTAAPAPRPPDVATAPQGPAPQVLEGIPRPIARPGPDVPTPPIASGAEVSYACESGAQLRVRYAGSVAEVAWTDGAWLTLSRTAPGGAGGETYAGERHVLVRLGHVVELRDERGGPVIRCAEATANA